MSYTEGTYASPRYFIPEDSPAHAEAWKIFQKIKWAKPLKRADAIKNRFNAFSAQLWAVTEDANWVVHTDLYIDGSREMLGVEDGKLNTYFNLRTKAIEPAVDEVNAITLIPSHHNF